MSVPKVLLAITAYNGREIVPRAMRSAKLLANEAAHVDIVVLDDCSPEPGFSATISALCCELEILYYRSPRNLGIPRNVNLAMLMAEQRGYDYVVISNSDVMYSANAIDELVRAQAVDPKIGSVTSWSTNVSVYSLPNTDPDRYLSEQGKVDWLGAVLAGQWSGSCMDIPAGISFCMLVPTEVIREVGIMDPVYGRGYCEEIDWSLRCLSMGYRNTLGLASFVYHQGRGSSIDAGVISGDQTSLPENEDIVDLRYPLFRMQVGSFLSAGLLQTAKDDAVRRIILDGARQFGYSLEVGWLPRPVDNDTLVQVTLAPDGEHAALVAKFVGFELTHTITSQNPGKEVRDFFGSEPSSVNVYDRGRVAGALVSDFGAAATSRKSPYPSRV
jgi:GT2 family glycosyltransferase